MDRGHFLSISCHGDQTVSWFVLEQFEKSLKLFKSRVWTVSLQRLQKFEVPRASVAPPREPTVPTSGPDPFRPAFPVPSTTRKPGWRNTAPPPTWQVQSDSEGPVANDSYTTDWRKCMEELLVNDMVYQHRVEQANERVNHYLAEELEIAANR